MNCITPLSIQDKKSFIKGKKINVPCGKCVACMARKRSYWSWRLQKEAEGSEKARFVTLTYDDEFLPFNLKGLKTLKKIDLIRYFKRLRKLEKKLRYFAVGEYGSLTNRPHYHAIIFNVENEKIIDAWKIDKKERGFVHCVNATDQTMGYVTKYMISDEIIKLKWLLEENGQEVPFQIMSKGLGKGYLSPEIIRFHKSRMEISVKEKGGKIQPLPRYIREKIFDKEQLRVLNELARKKAVEKDVDKKYEDIVSERRRFKYLASKKSKSIKL